LGEVLHAWAVLARDVVCGGTEPFEEFTLSLAGGGTEWFEEFTLSLAEVSWDRLFGLVFLLMFLPIFVDIGKSVYESMGRYHKGIELSHRLWVASGCLSICWSERSQCRSELLGSTAKRGVIWRVCEWDKWCYQL
jgi:hypothetical protein